MYILHIHIYMYLYIHKNVWYVCVCLHVCVYIVLCFSLYISRYIYMLMYILGGYITHVYIIYDEFILESVKRFSTFSLSFRIIKNDVGYYKSYKQRKKSLSVSGFRLSKRFKSHHSITDGV